MFAALLAMRFSNNVELGHPRHGSNNNPDVVVEFRGQRWGLACKVPTSSHAESLIQNVEKAAQQVLASGVDAGFPMFNLRNVLPADSYWRADPKDPTGRTFMILPSPQELLRVAQSDVAALWQRVECHVGADVFVQRLSHRPCIPAVIAYTHVMAPVQHETFAAATTSRFASCFTVGPLLPAEKAFADAMHASAIAL